MFKLSNIKVRQLSVFSKGFFEIINLASYDYEHIKH